jgi:hypothetical protein
MAIVLRPDRSRAITIALGLVLATAAFIVHVHVTRVPSKAVPPPTYSGAHAVADDIGALDEVLMHYVPELEDVFDVTYQDFLRSLPRSARIVFVIQRGRRRALDAFIARTGVVNQARVVEIDVPLGIWSKDRALVLRREAGGSMLLVPPKHDAASRPFDAAIVPAVVKALPERGFELREMPLAFDAGDFAIAGDTVLFDANLLGRNRARGVATAAALLERMRGLLGRDVVMLGTEEGDVPRHHMSMYMAPLPGRTVLVGDPSLAKAIIGEGFAPGEVSVESGRPLVADFSAPTQARFDRAARDLGRAGFRVVRIPNVPFEDKTYFAYTNGVFETREGRRSAWVPTFGVDALDRAAFAVFEAEGFGVNPVRVRKVYTQHGTIGCLVNVLSRS